MAVEYKRTSPYFDTKVVNNKYLDVLNFRRIPATSSDVEYTITETYKLRPDLLAFDLYKSSDLWWVFVARNPNVLKDPVFDFVVGTKIYLPNKNTIDKALGL
jgi:hypothetical protein